MPMNHKKIKNSVNVINVRKKELKKMGYDDFQDWVTDKNHVYIGRNMNFYVKGAVKSDWCNPFPVAKPGKIYKHNAKRYTLDESLLKYKKYIEKNKIMINRLSELEGKTLGCWCKPEKCHGDVLAKLVKKHCK